MINNLRITIFTTLLLATALVLPGITQASDVNISGTVIDTTATLSGFAPASSIVFFKEDGFIVGSAVADSTGHFTKTITSSAGSHTYSVYLTDNQGKSTPEIKLSPVNLIAHADFPISNIHLPPTIGVSKTKIVQGDIVTISGQASPGSVVNIFVNKVKRFSVTVGSNSRWSIDLNGVNIADHSEFYAISTRPGLADSEKSFVVTLDVLACSDENCNRTPSTPGTTTPTATPSAGTTTTGNKNVIYEIGQNLARTLLFTSIFIVSLIAIIVIFLIFLLSRRRKKKEDLLTILEQEVTQDLYKPNPAQLIHTDFAEIRKEFE